MGAMRRMSSVTTLLFMVLVAALPVRANAVSETGYADSIKTRVLPYIRQNLKRHDFNSFDGTRIRYATLVAPQSRATVVISQGRTESIIGLSEVIYDLSRMGYSVAVIDHRGQGESQRLVPNSNVGHVNDFADYVGDFKIFVEKHVKVEMPGPYVLMASSMGGAIASLYMIEAPQAFKAAVLGAPMINIDMDPFPLSVVTVIASGLSLFENETAFAPTRGPYNFNQKFAGNTFTHSPNRFYLDVALTRRNPVIATGGPSLGWVRAALRAGFGLSANANRLKTPTLLFQAGLDDIVENSAQAAFCEKAAECHLTVVPGAYHWIFMESDSIRNRLFIDLDFFFQQHLAATH